MRLPWLSVLLSLLAGCAPDAARDTVTARRGDLPLVLVESGEIQAERSLVLRAPTDWETSLVIVAMAAEGTLVAEGDTVVRFDTSPLLREFATLEDRLRTLATQREGTLAEQRVQRRAREGAVEAALLAREQAELQVEKLRFESRVRQDEARLAADRAANALEEARAKLAAQAVLDSLAAAKAELELADALAQRRALEARRAALTLRSPAPGLVVHAEREDMTRRRVKSRVGDTVSPTDPLVQIPDLSAMQVEMMVHEIDRHRIAVGLPVRVRLEAYPEAEFTGRITEIARLATEVEPDSGVRGFATVARLDGADPRLRPGMSAVVEVVLGTVRDVTLVPRTALGRHEGQTVVYPRRTWPRPQPVRLAALTPLVAAVAEGVAPGTELAAAPPREAS